MNPKGGSEEIYEIQERLDADNSDIASFRKKEVACEMVITACEGFKSARKSYYSIVPCYSLLTSFGPQTSC